MPVMMRPPRIGGMGGRGTGRFRAEEDLIEETGQGYGENFNSRGDTGGPRTILTEPELGPPDDMMPSGIPPKEETESPPSTSNPPRRQGPHNDNPSTTNPPRRQGPHNDNPYAHTNPPHGQPGHVHQSGDDWGMETQDDSYWANIDWDNMTQDEWENFDWEGYEKWMKAQEPDDYDQEVEDDVTDSGEQTSNDPDDVEVTDPNDPLYEESEEEDENLSLLTGTSRGSTIGGGYGKKRGLIASRGQMNLTKAQQSTLLTG